MDRRGRKLRFTAVAVLVVLALTGFSTSRGHGHGHSSGHGSGGGCSSSGQDHDSSSSSSSGGTSGSRYRDYDDDDDDDTGGTSGGSAPSAPSATLRDATVKLLSCASQNQPYAVVEITNPNATGGRFTVAVDFLDAGSDRLTKQTAQQYVAGNETTTVRVDLSGSAAAEVDHCEPEPYAPAA